MAQESKEVDQKVDKEAIQESLGLKTDDTQDKIAAEGQAANGVNKEDHEAAESIDEKKKSKKDKLKKMIGGKSATEDANHSDPAGKKLTPGMVDQLLDMNPSLKSELSGLDKAEQAEAIKKLDAADLLAGMSVTGKNQKDMASYKFWQTQPVPRFDEPPKDEDGPIQIVDPQKVPQTPPPLPEGYEWDTMNLTEPKQIEEVFSLLTKHYVEDDEAMFRFNYSTSFFNWALKSPGWTKEWHVGVRASKTQQLLAFISAVPVDMKVRKNVLKCSEVNFLCVHKKLRSKRLAPVLIREITRRCNLLGIYQAVFTAGIVLPKPVSTCRYYHRSLDWLKLYEIGFSPLPANSTKMRQISRYQLPISTSTPNLRAMEMKDAEQVSSLLERYLEKFDLAPKFSREEVEHWLVHDEKRDKEQIVWSYVVEDPSSHGITDFFSFYCLESSVIKSQKHETIRAAYGYYYATEAASKGDERAYKERLTMLMTDALILAKNAKFDVFNALTLLDNPLFLEQLKFGAGDGQLHYYLFNYRTPPISGGVDEKNRVDEKYRGGIGLVML